MEKCEVHRAIRRNWEIGFKNPVEYFRTQHVHPFVKTNSSLLRLLTCGALLAFAGSSVSCMTTYDAYGRPVETVDPGLAVAGIAAAGLIGYAAANNHSHYREYDRRPYYGGGYYRPCY